VVDPVLLVLLALDPDDPEPDPDAELLLDADEEPPLDPDEELDALLEFDPEPSSTVASAPPSFDPLDETLDALPLPPASFLLVALDPDDPPSAVSPPSPTASWSCIPRIALQPVSPKTPARTAPASLITTPLSARRSQDRHPPADCRSTSAL
jgi:hypothetical protein